MRIVVRDHSRNRREVYNVRDVRRNRAERPVVDSDDDKIKDLEERIKTLEEEVKALSKKSEDKEPEESEKEDEDEVEEEELDEVEEDEDIPEDNETVEDLGDSCTFGDSIIPKKSLRSIGALAKKTATTDSIDNEEAEINAWKNR
jgi:TolA-binding protein